jgi:glycosyltransferase involved in cell wall biosynthesis
LGARLRRPAIFLTPRLPWPLDDGGRIASWMTVWAAAREWDVTLISFVPAGTESQPAPAALAEIGATVERVPHRPAPVPVAAVSGLVGRWPYTLSRYRSDAFGAVLRDRLERLRPGYVFANHLHMATYADILGGTPMILREHNVEHIWMNRHAHALGPTPAGMYARFQAKRLRAAEGTLCRSAALTLAIQDRETECLRALAPNARIETLPVGVDLGAYGPRQPVDPPVFLIAGSFAWGPNVEGALRFLREGWPRVRKANPRIRLRVAGKDQPAMLRDLAQEMGAESAPNVPSMGDEFARATALIVPLWIGAGARIKIIEALAASLPVVSTPEGAEGLGLTPGTHYIEGASPANLADAALGILRDSGRGDALARAGRAFAETHWSHVSVARLQNDLVAQVAR